MKNKEAMTLIEILICIALIPIVILGLTAGINVMRTLQYRTDSLMHLSYTAGGVMEEWKAKPFEELKPGSHKINLQNLKKQEKIVVIIKDTKDKNLKEIRVEAELQDTRHPLKLEFTTLVVK